VRPCFRVLGTEPQGDPDAQTQGKLTAILIEHRKGSDRGGIFSTAIATYVRAHLGKAAQRKEATLSIVRYLSLVTRVGVAA
jgi:hypothetical protein